MLSFGSKKGDYEKSEKEKNSIVHGFGGLLALVALIIDVVLAGRTASVEAVICVSIYGLSLLMLYVIACIFHGLSTKKTSKKTLKVLDLCNVQILVVGTMIPFAILGVGGILGKGILIVACTFGLIGIVLALLEVEALCDFSILCHLIASWSLLVGSSQLIKNTGFTSLALIIIGGLLYTIGIIRYMRKDREGDKNAHLFFHIYCLGGCVLHFLAITLFMI